MYHSTLGSRVIEKKKNTPPALDPDMIELATLPALPFGVWVFKFWGWFWGLRFRTEG